MTVDTRCSTIFFFSFSYASKRTSVYLHWEKIQKEFTHGYKFLNKKEKKIYIKTKSQMKRMQE